TDVGGSDPASLDRFVKVVASRSLDGGRTWSQVTTVQTATDFNDKPAVTADPRRPGTAYLVFTRGHHPDFTAGDLMVSATHDGGVTWSRPVAIYAARAGHLSVGHDAARAAGRHAARHDDALEPPGALEHACRHGLPL